jgi:hypothetical protein
MQSWQSVLITQQVDGPTVANSTVEATLVAAQARYNLPANAFTYAGQALRFRAMGRVSNIVTTPGTLTFRIRFGGVAAGAIVANSGALALNTAAKTNVTWILDWDLNLRGAPGTAASMMFSGQWQSESVIGSPAAGAGGASSHIFPASAPAVGATFDSTVSQVIDLSAQWSVANAGNSIQMHTYKLESLN